MSEHPAHPVVAAARALGPTIAAARRDIDAEGTLPSGLVDAMIDGGLFRLSVPVELGGLAIDRLTFMAVAEEVAKADGSAAWTVVVGNNLGALSRGLPPHVVETLFSAGPSVISAGSAVPTTGQAERVPGGYRVNGIWKFASGARSAAWFILSCPLKDGESFVRDAAGAVQRLTVLVPANQVRILDTWHVVGLRGSSSNDVEVDAVFVPEAFATTAAIVSDDPSGFPATSVLGLMFSTVGLGIARTAIDCVTDLAGAKKPVFSGNLLRERASVQADVARAEIKLRAARGLLYGMVDTLSKDAAAGRAIDVTQRALLRGAIVNAAQVSAEVTDLMYNVAGATSLYETFPLERCWRDVHAVTQQIMVSPQFWEVTGRVLLGMDPGPLPF